MDMLTAPHAVLAVLVLVIASLAAISDLRTGLIPNRLVAGGGLLLVSLQTALALVAGEAPRIPGILLGSLLGAVACLLVPLAIYLARGLGGGDLKLLVVCGAGLGPVIGLEAQLYAFGLGCVFAVGRALHAGMLWRTLRGSTSLLANGMVPSRLRREVDPSVMEPIRFAPWIFAGVATAVAMHWQQP
jgi:prepilin peptidase CpaA